MLASASPPDTSSPNALIDALVRHMGPRLGIRNSIRWEEYNRLRAVIEDNYAVPMTACTPIMARFLFAIGDALNAQHIVGLGTYVGYCVSWLIGLQRPDKRLIRAELVDIDPDANATARANCAALGYGEELRVIDASAERFIDSMVEPADLLFLDVDDPQLGKHTYTDLLDQMTSKLKEGAIIIAHDPLVPRFKENFERFHNYIKQSESYDGPWVLPIDECGVSIAVRRA